MSSTKRQQDTPATMLAELRNLSNTSKQNVYKRATLAAELLADNQWVAEAHQADITAAREYLESEFFGDLSGALNLADLLLIRKWIPDEKVWEAARYNLKTLTAQAWKIEDENNPRRKQAGEVERKKPVPHKEHEKVAAENEYNKGQAARFKFEAASLKEENDSLKTLVRSQERTNERQAERFVTVEKNNAELKEAVARLTRENRKLREQVAELTAKLEQLERRELVGAA